MFEGGSYDDEWKCRSRAETDRHRQFQGIRLPKVMLEKYGWSESLVVEETDDGVFLRGGTADKLSWEDTYREMAAEREDWSDLHLTLADGLE